MSAPHHVLILTADQNRGEKQQRVLEKHGYRVKQANDLQDALARIQEREPDVVVTDLWVGDSPTALVVKTIQKVAPKAQFIAIQLDVTQTQYARDAMHAGAFCTLPATCENHLLLATVLRAVETRLLRSDLAEVQERLALFFRSVDTGILLVDADSRQIVDVNPAAETLCRRSKEALVGRVSDAPDSGLPHLRTLTTLHLGGKAYWLQGIDDDLGASRYDELLAKLSVLQSVVFEDVSDVCLTVMANGRIENVIHGGVLAGVRMQVGRDAADLFRGDARAEFEYACKRVFETGEPQYLSRIGSDGPEMSVRILPVMSRDVVGSALVHTRHIDANVREERRLRLRDKATDDAGIGLLIVSSEGLIIDANQHLLDRLGFTRRVLMEKCYWMIDRECREEHWGDLWAGLDVDLKQMGDRIYRDVREGPAAMRVSMRRVVDGSDTFAVFLSQDAAELLAVQDAVEDLRAHDQVVLDLIQDSVIALDRRGYIREANKAACEWLHRDPARVVGKCYYDVLPEALAQPRKAHIESVFIGGKNASFVDQDSEHSFENHLIPVRNRVGMLTEIIILSRRIWQPVGATIMGSRQDADYSLEADQHARMLASSLVQERVQPTLDALLASSSQLSACVHNRVPPGEEQINALAQALREARDALNSTVHELYSGEAPRPGLMASLSLIANESQMRWGVECACNVSITKLDLEPGQVFHLCAIARDAVEFSAQRRSAHTIKISVKTNRRELNLRIADDGDAASGQSFAASGVIMALIERRAKELGARISLESNPEGGESLTCTLMLGE